ncbi:MAG: hypothetical protein WEA09_12225 [Gemmatimonadota bacterium]
MRNGIRWMTGVAMAAVLLVGTTACDDFLVVENPTVVNAAAVDPAADAGTFALSAQQNFATAYGWLIMYGSWYTGEAEVSETFPTRNEYGRRDVDETNGSNNGDLWVPLTLASSSAEGVLRILAGSDGENSNVNVARAALFAGYSALFMSQDFCEGTIAPSPTEPGPRMSQAQLRDHAVQRFSRAIEVASASASSAAPAIRDAALVGRARTYLQAGQRGQAQADAQQVPDGFVFTMTYQDDAANRTRLANRIWQFTQDRGSVSVAPAYRVDDPRVPWSEPDGQFTSQDASVEFYRQLKYTEYGDPIRLASKKEADYIAAEAQGTQAMLALIQAERAANDQPAYDGPTDDQSVLVEFLEQRGREFFLEGQRMGDLQRHGNIVPHVPQPGAPYFKDGFAPIGSGTCYPVPIQEKSNNPNFG